jgi:uncharacterized protein YdeI (YjbR/CyaY-like superfamily)
VWSKINKGYVDELQAKGLLAPAGLAAIERAKLNGSWDALNNSDNLTIPPELAAAFARELEAKANFEAFSESTRRNTLQWVYDAKTDETRMKRIEKIVQSAKAGVRLR